MPGKTAMTALKPRSPPRRTRSTARMFTAINVIATAVIARINASTTAPSLRVSRGTIPIKTVTIVKTAGTGIHHAVGAVPAKGTRDPDARPQGTLINKSVAGMVLLFSRIAMRTNTSQQIRGRLQAFPHPKLNISPANISRVINSSVRRRGGNWSRRCDYGGGTSSTCVDQSIIIGRIDDRIIDRGHYRSQIIQELRCLN